MRRTGAATRRRGLHCLRMPGLVALSTVLGLGAGLLGDRGWDVAAAAGLVGPIVAVSACLGRSRRQARSANG